MYTSGRTVKSTAKTAPTTRVTATREVRRLVTLHVPTCEMVSIASSLVADVVTFDLLVRTVVTFPKGTDVTALVKILKTFDDLAAPITASAYDITITRTA